MIDTNQIQKGQIIEGRITNITDFGIFVQLSDEITGLLHKLNIDNGQDVYSYKKGQSITVVVQKIKDGKISFGLPTIYDEKLFLFDTNELLNYLGFSTSTFIGKAERGKHFVYFKNLMTINQTKFLNPITNQNIDARCGADSICQCSLEDIEKVCARDSVCKEQVAILDTIIDNHWYEIELIAGRPEFRQKYNDPFRFSVYRIKKEIILDNSENTKKEEDYNTNTMNKIVRQEPDSVRKAKSKVFHKMYVANVRNRLRQLNEPTENDCKRWIWELIQNAKDSISQDPNLCTVDIKVEVNDDRIIFKHNGSPFTADAQQALLYKYSEGKENSESTGRFGTGFLTTHTLSKIVSIEGPLYNDDSCQSVCGFSTIMFRDGLDERDLLDGLTKMEDSMKYFDNSNGWTTYTYHLKTPQNRNALELGLKNFISNIAQVMLFCKELNSVELNGNGTITQIIRKQPQQLSNDIFISEFEIKNNGTTDAHTRKFVHKYLEKHSNDLTTRFKTDRNLRLMAAIEIDNENNLVENETAPSHFCVLPLVGSEKHIMPIYLNSPDFEPDSERESLILIGDDMLADKNVISEGGINRLILKESIELYDSLVSYLSENCYHKLYLLAKGLKRMPDFEKNFNKEWFEKEMILPYREVLKKYAIVETKSGNQKLFDKNDKPYIVIPKDKNLNTQNLIYELAEEIFPNQLPLKNYSAKWASLAWEDCGLFKIDDLCKSVAEKENIDNLLLNSLNKKKKCIEKYEEINECFEKMTESLKVLYVNEDIGKLPKVDLNKIKAEVDAKVYEWLNKFLQFVKETDESLLKKYALVPNSNGDFVSLEMSDFVEGVGLTEFMLNTLLSLGVDLKPKLLNSKITVINLPIKVDAKSIAEKIDEQADCIIKDRYSSDNQIITKLLPLLNIISNVTKYEPEFVEKQITIHYFAQQLFSDHKIQELSNSDIPAKAWNSLHKWLIIKLIKETAEYKKMESLPANIENKIEWLNNFIEFVIKEDKISQLDTYAIIPNQKGDFCLKKDLWKDANIPEVLKSEEAESFGIILKNTLLHKDINTVEITQEKDIRTVIDRINYIFKNNLVSNYSNNSKNNLDFKVYLLHFLPEESSQMYNSQKSLLDIVRKYYYNRSKPYSQSTTIPCNTEDFWNQANARLLLNLQKDIEENTTIEGLKEFLSQSGKEYDNGDTIIFLNNFYDYLKQSNSNISRKIIPNQKGDFCLLDNNLFKDDNIPDELKEVLSLVDPAKDFRKILAENSLSIQPTYAKTIKDIAEVIDETIKSLFSNSRNWDDENFKKGVAILTEYFRKHKNPDEIFKYSWSKKDSIELNVLWSEKDREMLKELKENGFEKVQLLLAKDAEIQKLTQEKEDLLAENQTLKKEKENLEQEIAELKEQLETIVSEEEKSIIEQKIIEKQKNLINATNEIAIIDSCVSSGLTKQEQKEINEEAREIVKQELEKRLSVEQKRQQEKGNNFSYQLTGFEGYSNSPIMQINSINYPIVVKSYKKQSEKFNINAIEWEQVITQPHSLFLVWDGTKINHIDILDLLKNQSHIDISFSTVNLDVEERLNKFSQSMQYFKDIQFKFSSFYSFAFGQATKLSNYFFDRKQEDDFNDNNSDIML